MDAQERMWAASTYGKNPAHYHYEVVANLTKQIILLERLIGEIYPMPYKTGYTKIWIADKVRDDDYTPKET